MAVSAKYLQIPSGILYLVINTVSRSQSLDLQGRKIPSVVLLPHQDSISWKRPGLLVGRVVDSGPASSTCNCGCLPDIESSVL